MQHSLIDILKQVFTSWQVIVITIVILLYIHIVNNAARKHQARRRMAKTPKIKKKEAEPLLPSDGDSDSSSNDELGLEEA